MKVFATAKVVELVRERGGALFVWADRTHDAQQVTYLEASTESPGVERTFRRLEGDAFDLFMDIGGREPPSELHLEVAGWPRRRIRALWNGVSFTLE
jgi:hypothetical protein